MNVVKVLRHGQITLPKTLREVLDIKEGDILEIELERSRLILKTKILVDKDKSVPAVQAYQAAVLESGPKSRPESGRR